jgi:hypothetical protein
VTGTLPPLQWWGGVLMLLAFFGPAVFIVAGAARSQRQNQRDILQHGRAAIGTVVSIRTQPIRGGQQWIVTVEFIAPDHPEPVRFDSFFSGTFWFTPKPVRDLREGQSVALHYREKWPSLAVIDDFVS